VFQERGTIILPAMDCRPEHPLDAAEVMPVIDRQDLSRTLPEQIWEMVRRIVERFDPERIVLFGSFSRGTPAPDSDADLLVVMPVHGSRRKLAARIELALVDLQLPKDVIVVTPEEAERDRDQIGTIIYPALREGVVLYER
jgi:predicted nucleotidyltransferase